MRERLCIWLAWHLPRRLVYWALVRAATYEPIGLRHDDFIVWEKVPDRGCLDAARIWSDYPQ